MEDTEYTQHKERSHRPTYTKKIFIENAKLKDFKRSWMKISIKTILENEVPMSGEWHVPSFVKFDQSILRNFLGDECYMVFSEMTDSEKDLALDYVTFCGKEISHLLEIPVAEKWDGGRVKANLEKLKYVDAELYQEMIDFTNFLLLEKLDESDDAYSESDDEFLFSD